MAVGSGATKASYAEASKRAMISVVNISSSRDVKIPANHPLANDPLFRRFFGQPNGDDEDPEIRGSLGSGVIVNADDKGGYVLTNDHVVASSKDIQVSFADGRVSVGVVGQGQLLVSRRPAGAVKWLAGPYLYGSIQDERCHPRHVAGPQE